VVADKAYSSRANRAWLRRHKIGGTIPEKDDQAAHRRARGSRGGRPPKFDAVVYKLRHAVECGVNRVGCQKSMVLVTSGLAWPCEG
jgi:hypothetical protein